MKIELTVEELSQLCDGEVPEMVDLREANWEMLTGTKDYPGRETLAEAIVKEREKARKAYMSAITTPPEPEDHGILYVIPEKNNETIKSVLQKLFTKGNDRIVTPCFGLDGQRFSMVIMFTTKSEWANGRGAGEWKWDSWVNEQVKTRLAPGGRIFYR